MKSSKLLCLALFLTFLAACAQKEAPIEVSSVSLNTATIEMVEGETFNLVATVLPNDAEYDGVTWASSNVSVAEVDGWGIVKALKEGTATIIVRAGEKEAYCNVSVGKRIYVDSIKLSAESIIMTVGESTTLSVMIDPENASDKTVRWTSSNASVAVVENGLISAKKAGSAEIKVTSYGTTGNSISSSCFVSVLPEDNIIVYESTNNKAIVPSRTNVFGANIISNEYVGSQGKIVFDAPVTEIGFGAFRECDRLKSITFPKTVTSIGDSAFQGCKSLKTVEIMKNVKAIGSSAFRDCRSLLRMTIPEGVSVIETNTFSGAFQWEPSPVGSPYNYVGTVSIDVPSSVKEIKSYAFYYSGIKKVQLHQGLLSIGDCAFSLSMLEEIDIPDGVKTLGSSMLHGPLRKVRIGEGPSIIPFAFCQSCKCLEIVELPSTIKYFDVNTFAGSGAHLLNFYIKAQTPPKERLGGSVFTDLNLGLSYDPERSIWVPRASVDAYKKEWSKYKDNIKGYDF